MKTKNPPQVVPIDLTGCFITKKEEDSHSLRFRLKGKTNSGVDVTGYWLEFDTVRNMYTLNWFFRKKSITVVKGNWENETSISYPLKLPSAIRVCQRTLEKKLSYDDGNLNSLAGRPEPRASEVVVMLALDERRFEDRGPIPIVCEKVRLLNKAGELVTAVSSSPEPSPKVTKAKASTKSKAAAAKKPANVVDKKMFNEMFKLGERFAMAVYFGSLEEAKPLMSKGFLKAHRVSGIRKLTGKSWRAAKTYKNWAVLTQPGPYHNKEKPWSPDVDESWYRDFMLSTLGLEVIIESHLRNELEHYDVPDYITSVNIVRGMATTTAPFFDRTDYNLQFLIVDEDNDGTLRIDAVGPHE